MSTFHGADETREWPAIKSLPVGRLGEFAASSWVSEIDINQRSGHSQQVPCVDLGGLFSCRHIHSIIMGKQRILKDREAVSLRRIVRRYPAKVSRMKSASAFQKEDRDIGVMTIDFPKELGPALFGARPEDRAPTPQGDVMAYTP